MKYLRDTNAVIGLLAGNAALSFRDHRPAPTKFSLSVIAMQELFYGAYKSQRSEENITRLEALRFAVLEFDKEDARQAGEIRAVLAAIGRPVGPYDVLIAGQARSRALTLITRNTSEFARVRGLRFENWEA